MAAQKPLTRSRLHEILAHYGPGVSMETKGGYDAGVYFSFTGRLLEPVADGGRIVGGRLAGRYGFCSEAIVATREETRSRGGRGYGIDLFFARCEAREATLRRWLADYEAKAGRSAAVADPDSGLLSEGDGAAVEREPRS